MGCAEATEERTEEVIVQDFDPNALKEGEIRLTVVADPSSRGQFVWIHVFLLTDTISSVYATLEQEYPVLNGCKLKFNDDVFYRHSGKHMGTTFRELGVQKDVTMVLIVREPTPQPARACCMDTSFCGTGAEEPVDTGLEADENQMSWDQQQRLQLADDTANIVVTEIDNPELEGSVKKYMVITHVDGENVAETPFEDTMPKLQKRPITLTFLSADGSNTVTHSFDEQYGPLRLRLVDRLKLLNDELAGLSDAMLKSPKGKVRNRIKADIQLLDDSIAAAHKAHKERDDCSKV